MLLKVIAIGLKGMIEEDRDNITLAKDRYQQAWDTQPDFVGLKQQLGDWNK